MAEHAVKRESMAIPQRTMSRRELLRKGATVGAAAVLTGAVGFSVAKVAETITNLSKEPESKYPTTEILLGSIEISKRVNIRTSPHATLDNRGEPGNQIAWEQIREINGVKYSGQEKFTVNTAELVKGDNPDGPPGLEGRWVKLRVKYDELGITKEESLFISLGSQTAGFVEINGRPLPVLRRTENGYFIKVYETEFTRDTIGRVSFPQRPSK